MADDAIAADTTAEVQPDAAVKPAEIPGNLTAPGSSPDGSQAGDPEDWQPPQTDENGFAIDGHGLPINLRRRALALADKGESEDPAQAVSGHAIATAADQLAAYDESYPSLGAMKKADLISQAETEGVALSEDATVEDIRAAIDAARPARI